MMLSAYLALGLVAGMLYFASLWWTAQSLARSGLTASVAALVAFRLGALALVLSMASRSGALPLLMTALGIFAGRAAVLRYAPGVW